MTVKMTANVVLFHFIMAANRVSGLTYWLISASVRDRDKGLVSTSMFIRVSNPMIALKDLYDSWLVLNTKRMTLKVAYLCYTIMFCHILTSKIGTTR